MKDFREDIPVYSFINAAIIDRALESDTFKDCVRATLNEAGFASGTQYQFKNPAFVCGLLYALILVPKEIWLGVQHDVVYRRLGEEEGLVELFEARISNRPSNQTPIYYLIHRLRNSIAHANFSVDETQAFTFWDKLKKTTPKIWEVHIRNQDLLKFLTKVAHVVVFLRDDATRKP
jgi:hypothetical protein